MDAETKAKIEEAVLEVLRGANMEEATEFKVRSMAAAKLGIDLNIPDRKSFVRGIVESFLLSQKDEDDGDGGHPAGEEEARKEEEGKQSERREVGEAEEEEEGNKKQEREFDDEGDPIICRLSSRRRVTVQDFRGSTLVSIREYYNKGGKELPSTKGISLTSDQWVAFRNAVPAIEDAIKQIRARSN